MAVLRSVIFRLVQALALLPVIHAVGSSEFAVPPPPPPSFWGLEGQTALVTGGTKGIGEELPLLTGLFTP